MFEENFNYIIVLFATLLLLTAYFVKIVYIFFSFTLYLADTRVGRGNLVLKHSVSYFSPNSGGIAYVSGGTQPRALPQHLCEDMKI